MSSLIDAALARAAARPERRIDHDRMNRAMPALKARLTRAVKTRDPEQVAADCMDAMDEWDACGASPDNWSAWQRALDDVLPFGRQVRLEDLARPPQAASRLF